MAVTVGATRRSNTMSAGRLSGPTWALGLGGCLFALGNLLHPLEHSDAAYHSPTWVAAHLTIFFSLPLLLIGLPVLGRVLKQRQAGAAASAAALLAVVGLVGMAPSLLVDAFVAPEIGHTAMEHLEAGGFGIVAGTLSLAWVISSVVLAVACWRGQFGPVWARLTLAAVSFALLLGAVSGPVGGFTIIVATAAYGVALARLGWEIGAP